MASTSSCRPIPRHLLTEYAERVSDLTAFAHEHGVAVEAEVGELPCGASDASQAGGSLTDPELAAEFVAATGVDLLAVSVGNVHIKLDGSEELDLRRLEQVRGRVPVPLVLHGGTGIAADSLREAIALGVAKVNYGTYLKQAYLEAMRAALDRDCAQPHRLLGMGGTEDILVAGRLAVRDAVLERIGVLGCCGRADDMKDVLMEVAMKMPDLATTGSPIKVVRWLVDVGHQSSAGRRSLEIETDKAVMVVESVVTGRLRSIAAGAAAGEEVSAGQTIAMIETERAAAPSEDRHVAAFAQEPARLAAVAPRTLRHPGQEIVLRAQSRSAAAESRPRRSAYRPPAGGCPAHSSEQADHPPLLSPDVGLRRANRGQANRGRRQDACLGCLLRARRRQGPAGV